MTVMDKFKSSIKRGTGEAVLIMQLHPEIDFSREIIGASIRHFGYDPQCEGGREKYLSALIDLSSNKNEIVEKLLDRLEKAKSTEWDYGISQVNYIASIYAQRGNQRARKILYALCRKNIGSESALIEVDGIDALKFIAEVKGKLLLRNSKTVREDWTVSDDYLIRRTKEIVPKSNPRKVLERESMDNPYIKRYLDEIDKACGKSKRRKSPKPTYSSIKKLIDNGDRVGSHISKNLSNSDLIRLAEDLLAETDKKRIYRMLSVFRQISFPLGFAPLMQYATSKDPKIRWQGIQALGLFKDKSIRKLAVDTIQSGKRAYEYLKLLEMNFVRTDNKLIAETLMQIKNIDAFHFAGIIICDIYTLNKTKGCLNALLELYRRGTCGICRDHAIEIMLENRVLPKELRKEIQYDCYVMEKG